MASGIAHAAGEFRVAGANLGEDSPPGVFVGQREAGVERQLHIVGSREGPRHLGLTLPVL